MPEMPEVETVRRDLHRRVIGRRIDAVHATGARTVRRTSPTIVRDRLIGRTITGTSRRGKYLIVELDDDQWMLVHLRMSGQLILCDGDAPLANHTHVRLRFDDERELRFVDPRTFGEVVVVDPANLPIEAPDVAALGPEPLEIERRDFDRIIRGRRRMLKAMLLDQHVVAGIGNIYADEICHAARLRYDRAGDSLSTRQVGVLHNAMQSILSAAIDARGSTLRDAQYVDLGGLAGGYQDRHAVYDRAGLPCKRCGRPIVRVVGAGRSTYLCPRCQR